MVAAARSMAKDVPFFCTRLGRCLSALPSSSITITLTTTITIVVTIIVTIIIIIIIISSIIYLSALPCTAELEMISMAFAMASTVCII